MDIRPITAAEAVKLGQEWQQQGLDWHFHMLPPTCIFAAAGTDRHCIVLEKGGGAGLVGVFTPQRDLPLGERLARIVHPRVFSDSEDLRTVDWLNEWLRRMEALNRDQVAWHHHMLYPTCALNHEPGSFVLVFEDPQGTGPRRKTFPTQPEAHFNTIERLYWAQQMFEGAAPRVQV